MASIALLIIDMQMEMEHRIKAGRDHVNPEAPARIAELVTAFRGKGLPVLHVWHEDEDPISPFYPSASTCLVMPCAERLENEQIFVKNTSSAFASTNLAEHLQKNGIDRLIVTGAVAGFCVNSTTRAGADLGFQMTIIRDAVLGFDLPTANLSAQAIFDVTMALLAADFAEIIDSSALLSQLA